MAEKSGAEGRVVVVTGATGDAGLAACVALGAAGAHVVAVGSRIERLAGVEAAHRFACDLTDADAVIELAQAVHDEVGQVDGVMHLVGGWRGGQSDEDWVFLESHIVDTLRHVSRAFRPDLTASTAGRLAVVSSTAVDRPTWSNANYATTKAAAETWVAALASGWAKAGTAAAVTFVVTSIGDGDGATAPSVIADAVASLWSEPASAINGARRSLVPPA
ncbi:MAG: SDR family oxidoreductase [Burkholderiaceae bacterium]|nr:SDR family oxidoreductase [Microbacteriaceae bacterium]